MSEGLLPTKVDELVQTMGLITHPEGGYFLETFRSGSTPMESRGQTNFNVEIPSKDLLETGRKTRPDGDGRRNPITSIYWVPTLQSPELALINQESDHVMLYHGGKPFEYVLYDPTTKKLERKILGPDVRNGHYLQVPIKGHVWACGKLVQDHDASKEYDYCILAEVFAPGFDVYDFSWVKKSQVMQECSKEVQAVLLPFLNENDEVVATAETTAKDFDSFYNDDTKKK